jgi:hypothetical protein
MRLRHALRTEPVDQLRTVNVSPRTVEAPHFSAEPLLNILIRNGTPLAARSPSHHVGSAGAISTATG